MIKRFKLFALSCVIILAGAAGAFAGCKKATVSVTLDYQDVVVRAESSLNKIEVLDARKDKALELPAVENLPYRFGGWFYEPGGLGGKAGADTVASENIVLYAYWLGSDGLEYEDGKVKRGELPETVESLVIAPAVDGVVTTEIGVDSFKNMISIKSVHFPYTLTKIANNSFYRCGLESVELPPNLRQIGMQAFYGCDKLETVVLPDSVESIGFGAFYACENLKYIRFKGSVVPDATTLSFTHTAVMLVPPAALDSFKDKFYGAEDYIYSHSALNGDFVIDEGKLVKYIGKQESATIPENVTSILANAFYSNRSLTQINIPSSVKTIENYAFSNINQNVTLRVAFAQNSIPAGFGSKWCFDNVVYSYSVEFQGN